MYSSAATATLLRPTRAGLHAGAQSSQAILSDFPPLLITCIHAAKEPCPRSARPSWKSRCYPCNNLAQRAWSSCWPASAGVCAGGGSQRKRRLRLLCTVRHFTRAQNRGNCRFVFKLLIPMGDKPGMSVLRLSVSRVACGGCSSTLQMWNTCHNGTLVSDSSRFLLRARSTVRSVRN